MDLDETIGAEILRLHRENKVKEVRFDPWQFASIANRLQKAGVNVVEMPQTAQRTEADQALYDGITSGAFAIFHSPALRESVRKAAAKESVRGFRMEKRPGDDLAVALSMAHYGAVQQAGHTWLIDPPLSEYKTEEEKYWEMITGDEGWIPLNY